MSVHDEIFWVSDSAGRAFVPPRLVPTPTTGTMAEASRAYAQFLVSHPSMFTGGDVAEAVTKLKKKPKKKPKKEKKEELSKLVSEILESLCQIEHSSSTGKTMYSCNTRSFERTFSNSSNFTLVKLIILRLLQGEDGSAILKAYVLNPKKEVLKDVKLLEEAKKQSFWKCVSKDKELQKVCAETYTYLNSHRSMSMTKSFTYLYFLTKTCNVEEMTFQLKCIKQGCGGIGLRFLPPAVIEGIHNLDMSNLSLLLGREQVRYGLMDGVSNCLRNKEALAHILNNWPKKIKPEKKALEVKNEALKFLTQGCNTDKWKVTRPLKGLQSNLGSLDTRGILYLFILSGIKVRDIYEMYLTNPLPLGQLMLSFYHGDKGKKKYEENLYTRWALEVDPITGLKKIISVGKIERGIVKSKLDFLVSQRRGEGDLPYEQALLAPVLSLKDLKISAERGIHRVSEKTQKDLLQKMEDSRLVFVYGWTPGGLLTMPSSEHQNRGVTSWYQKITSKLLEEAKTDKLDSGLGVLVSPLRSFNSKGWDPSVSQPRKNKGLSVVYDQVTMLRPSSGAAVWLDKDKRVFESGADGSRYSFTHGCHTYRGTTILGASTVGYKKDELRGWIHVSVNDQTAGGVLILPDKDWDSMSFLFERGLFFTPQASEHRGLRSTRVPSQNGHRDAICFGGFEENDPFRTAKSNQACTAACLMFTTSNADLTKLGTMGYAFPEGYIGRGMSILKKKIEKIKDHDLAISIMSKIVMYEMGCVCVKYGKKENEGVIAAPVLEGKIWDWNTLGTFDITDPVRNFPGSILRPASLLNNSQHLRGRRPIGGYMPYDKDGVMLGTSNRMCGYEKYLNAYKPLGLGLTSPDYDSEEYEEGDYSNEVISPRNASDNSLRGRNCGRDDRPLSSMKEWRKL